MYHVITSCVFIHRVQFGRVRLHPMADLGKISGLVVAVCTTLFFLFMFPGCLVWSLQLDAYVLARWLSLVVPCDM